LHFSLARPLRIPSVKALARRVAMNKHIFQGLVCGGIFASSITWVAVSDAIAEGGFALLASAVFGLTAGLCIGGLIAANFVMMVVEEQKKSEAIAHRTIDARVTA
jgi:hypothetical protein